MNCNQDGVYFHVAKETLLPLEGNSAGAEQDAAELYVEWKRQRGWGFGGGIVLAGQGSVPSCLGMCGGKLLPAVGKLPEEINPREE